MLVLAGRLSCICSVEKEKRASCSSACSKLRNDLGLLAEEYDPKTNRQLGNFPQAFSHVALVNTAYRLSEKLSLPGKHSR